MSKILVISYKLADTCVNCNGSGKVFISDLTSNFAGITATCEGTGGLLSFNTCPLCNGKGYVETGEVKEEKKDFE